MIRPLLRSIAILIAVLGAIDPALTSERTAPVTISLIDTTAPNALVNAADAVGAVLATHHTVVRGASADAALTIVTGDAPPPHAAAITTPAIVVVPPAGPGVAIARVMAPSRASFESRVPVRVELRAIKDRAARVVVALQVSGAVVDRVEKDVPAGVPPVIDLSFVPVARGPVAARVSAAIAGSEPRAFADLAVNVDDRTWSILVFDRRPSWMSTFVRRALEADARFRVTSRTTTSTGVAAASADAPVSLDSSAGLDRFDAIVVGAPDALSRDDAAALAVFARGHGGAVVALMDRNDAGPLGALAGLPQWTETQSAAPIAIAVGDGTTTAGLRGSEFAAPTSVPAAAEVGATVGAGAARRPIVVNVPIGAGRLILSGMLDAWRYRGAPESSAFDAFWRDVVGRAADATPPPLGAQLSAAAIGPGDETTLDVTIRDVALSTIRGAGVETRVNAELRSGSASSPVRLWPAGPGRFTASVRAPSTPGTYRIDVSDGTHTTSVPFIVVTGAKRPTPDNRELAQAWAASRGGTTLDAPDAAALLAAVDQLAHPSQRSERWHPMRNGWWILPFALLLGAEWWLRRRGDLA
ncbi:MAG TPA: hypothetical protein VFV98_18190 [Vicinamibacterales bacterium]|nr:hypothetical protein [Vicinamibacterales bacterium]